MKNPIKRFADFLGVAGYLFVRGFSASKLHSLASIFFEGLAFLWVIAAATSLAMLATAGGSSDLPEQLMRYIPEGQAFTYGVMGMVISLLGGAISKFLSNYIINIALPKVETKFYGEGANNFATADIIAISQLDVDAADYLKRDLSINARFAMMVYRRILLTVVPVITLFFLLPTLAIINFQIMVAMGLIFIFLVPVYYFINRKSNQITLDMEVLSREVSGQRRKAAEAMLSADYDPADKDEIIAPTLSHNNKDVKRFFHLYGERFTMSEATSLTNTFVLFLLVGVLAYMTWQSGAQNAKNINIADFIIVLVVLRQVHTVVSRGLLVTNTMSRFYTKLLALKTINNQISTFTGITPEDAAKLTGPVENLRYKHVHTDKGYVFDMRPGNVHLMLDNNPPSRLSLLGLKPATDVKNFANFISSRTIDIINREEQKFNFTDHIGTPKNLDNILKKHSELLSWLYDESELRRIPETPMDFMGIMQNTLGDGISYLRPRTIKIYELMIDLQEKLKASKADVVFLDVRTLIRFQPPYAEKALEMMKSTDKVVFVVVSKQHHANFGFDPHRLVLIKGRTKAEGYIELSDMLSVMETGNKRPTDDLDDEMNM